MLMIEAVDPFECERCGRTDDAIAALGRRSLCTECRQALDLCTMCAAPALSGEWWCVACEIAMDDYCGDGDIPVVLVHVP